MLTAVVAWAGPPELTAKPVQSQFSDDFSGYPTTADLTKVWDTSSAGWSVRDGALAAREGTRGDAVLVKAPFGAAQVIEVTLTVGKAISKEWKVAGILVQCDSANYWHLALGEKPDEAKEDAKGHFIELCEAYDGAWLAQSEGTDTRLTLAANDSPNQDWQYDHPYRLRVELTLEGITGTASELDGRLLWRRAYRFDNKAVRYGRAGFDCGGFEAAFDDFHVEVTQAVSPKREAKTYPTYAVKSWPEIKGKASGFLHAERKDGVWWVIDPTGNAFYVLGTDHANFNSHWCEKLGYAPYHKNCEAKYGSEQAWATSTASRLKDWGFNSLGAGCSPSVRYQGLAHTEFLSMGAGFAGSDDICPRVHWTGFPNVFSPDWEQHCDKIARQVCERNRNDPWLLGYFIDNELEWFGKNGKEWGLADEILRKPADHSAKLALRDWAAKRYRNSIKRFNAAWGTKLKSLDDLLAITSLPEPADDQQKQARLEVVRLIADRYFGVAAAAIRKHDPNHMILGCRFAGWAPPVWDIAGKHCDIVSCNYYGWVDLDKGMVANFKQTFDERYAKAKRPIMITEWSFPALDSGLPCTHGAGQRFDTQEQRSKAWLIFQRQLFELPYMVGSDYFMWMDEPALGISSTFPENTNYGLVNEQDEPYQLLTEAATRLNPQVYEIHSGRQPKVELSLAKDGETIQARNLGKVSARAEITVWVDGQESRKRLTLAPGETKPVPIEAPTQPGGHLLMARVGEGIGERQRAWTVAYRPDSRWPSWNEQFPRVPVVVANTSDRAVPAGPVTFDGREFPADVVHAWSRDREAAVVACDATGTERLPLQLDMLGGPFELSLLAPEIPARTCVTALLFFTHAGGKVGARRLETTFRERRPNGFEAGNGVLRLTNPGAQGVLAEEVLLKDSKLGKLTPLIWQSVGQNLWVAPDRIESVKASNGPVRLAIEVTTSRSRQGEAKTEVGEGGAYARQEQRPRAFRTTYRLCLYPDKPWFVSQFVSITNTDPQPWQLRGYYHYALPLGADDQPLIQVPNYYAASTAAWVNEGRGLAYGVVAPSGEGYSAGFWKDESGAEHADAVRHLDLRLAPGQSYDEPQREFYVFGMDGTDPAKVRALAAEIRAMSAIEHKVFPAEHKK